MAQKESTHREIVDDLTGQLTQVRRQHEELTTLSRDQVCVCCQQSQYLADVCVGCQHVL
jgi:hypothetical protein